MRHRKPPPGQVVREGLCLCVGQPMGRHGLEGYDRGEQYKFQECRDAKGRYFRVYPSALHDWGTPTYYESCGPNEFSRYFEEIVPHGPPPDDQH